MKTRELIALLIVPLMLIAFSSLSLLASASLSSVDERMTAKELDVAWLESQLADMEARINIDDNHLKHSLALEVISLSRDSQSNVRDLYGEIRTVANETRAWMTRRNYFILLVALLNALVVVVVYRSSKEAR
jgi:hypothetical protein